MVSLILLRSDSSVDKTALSQVLVRRLKNDFKKDCAYICEDDFKRKMQTKYKVTDDTPDKNSAEIIKAVISTVVRLDRYDYVIVEGLFRLKEVLDNYKVFCKEYKYKLFVFEAISKSPESEFGDNVKKEPVKYAIPLDVSKPFEEVADEMISKLKMR